MDYKEIKFSGTIKCEDNIIDIDGNGNNDNDQLLIDLHRQFAENNNSILGSAITLLVAALGVLAGYGYVFLNTYNEWDCDLWTMKCCSGNYTLNALYFTALAVTIILLIMIYVFFYQGIAGRKEQFIVYAIRHKLNSKLKPGDGILPQNYHPFDKECLEPIQGLYGEGVKIMMVLILIVQIVTFYRICSTSVTACNYLNLILVPLVLCLVTALMCSCILCKYKNMCDEYKAINLNRAHEENAESLKRM